MAQQYQVFGELLSTISPEEWTRPTRCAGWTVADVAAHVSGQLADVVNGRYDGLGSPEVTERQVQERRGRTPSDLVDELVASGKTGSDITAAVDDAAWDGPAPGGLAGTLGFGVEALFYDAFVHGDDIRAALGRPSVRDDGLLAAVSHVSALLTEKGWGPAVLRFGDLGEFPVGGGGGRVIEADPLAFVLVATGRANPAPLGLDETVNVYAG
jgi:uncharacterized protein (TIGR03083 family)